MPPTTSHEKEPTSQTAPVADDRIRRRAMPGLRGKNVLVTGRHLGDRAGDRRPVRRARRQRRDQLPDDARGGGRDRGAGARLPAKGPASTASATSSSSGDVSSEEDVVRMVDEATERLGGLDILVNNAGIQISRPSEQLSSARVRQGARGQPARRVSVRPRGDQAISGRREAGRGDQRLERPRGHPQAATTSATSSARAGCRT